MSELTYNQLRYRDFKKHHICVECGIRDAFHDKVRCPECLEKRLIYESKHRNNAKHNEIVKARLKKKRAAGICYNCDDPVCEESVKFCKKHLEQARAYFRRYQKNKRARERQKTLDQIAQERSERGKRNIEYVRTSPKYLAHNTARKEYWDKKYWSVICHV